MFGLGGLAGCQPGSGGPAGTTSGAAAFLSGTSIVWVDTVLGAAPPSTRTGDLATTTSSDLGDAIVAIAKGCVTVGDGGGGVFFWDDVDTSAVDDGGTVIIPSGTSLPGCWKRISEGSGVSVLWFGAVASHDGSIPSVSSTAAFTAAIHALQPDPVPAGAAPGPAVIVPAGSYSIATTLVVDRGVVLRGATGTGWAGTSILNVPLGTDGIQIFSAIGSTYASGNWAVLEDLVIKSTGGWSTETGAGRGIVMNARALIERCYVTGFAGTAIHIEGNTGDTPGTAANNWSIRHVRIDLCANGLYVAGTDANAGVCVGLDASWNRGWGIWDHSALGNTYVGCHVNQYFGTGQTGVGSYKADGESAHSLFLGCYAEGGVGASHIVHPSTWLGGSHGPAFDSSSNGLRILDAENVTSFTVKAPAGATTPVTTQVGDAGNSIALQFSGPDEPNPWRLQYNTHPSFPGWWWLWFGNINYIPIALGGSQATGNVGDVWFLDGLMISSPAIKLTAGSAAPSSGGTQGDIVFNKNAASGQPMGWVRAASGWIPLANIP